MSHHHRSSARPTGYPSITATARISEALHLYGHTPHYDEPEYRPMPDDDALADLVASLFTTVASRFADTALAPETDPVLWGLANLFARQLDRLQRLLDDNESTQRQAQEQQDGSELRSVELERLIDKGQQLLAKRAAFEAMRDAAATAYTEETGSVWRPRSGSMVTHKTMTAATIDSRDYIAAKRRAETEVMLPNGPKIAITGGATCTDHVKIWAVLDKALAKYADMVLLHGGNPTGVDAIAAAWAANRKVVAIGFRPDWARDAKAAPFKRNDRLLEVMPLGVIVFPGNGITDNLADKAKRLGITVSDFRSKA
jgi:hypothetical protein